MVGNRLRRALAELGLVLLLAAVRALAAHAQITDLDALNSEVERLSEAGKYGEAVDIAKRALVLAEQRHGPDALAFATSLNNLAELYREQGRYAEAQPLHKQALAIREKALDRNHPDVATSLNNLAELERAQGRYADAETLHKQALAIREKVFGLEHRDVATSLNNLGQLYHDQGQYAQAELHYKRSLAISEKVLDSNHPDLATTLNNLADLYRALGRYADAEPLYKRDLAITEKALGPDHEYVATTLHNLAELYREQGRYAEAEPLYKRDLAISERALGPDHPDVATTLNNLAQLYRAQGRYAEAEPLYKRSYLIWEKRLSPHHPDVATSLNNLAGLYRAQGRYADAEPLYKRSLMIREKAFDLDHPDVATSLNNLGELYRAQGRFVDAEPLYKRSIEIWEKKFGPDHPDVAMSLNNLAGLYRAQGRLSDSKALQRRIEKIPGWEVADIPILFATNRTPAMRDGRTVFTDEQQTDPDKGTQGLVVLRAPQSEVVNRAERGAQSLGQLDRAAGRGTDEALLQLYRLETTEGDRTKIAAAARDRLSRASRFPRQALISVHGYNVSFEDAVKRAALIAFDLDFDGIAAAFAWASKGGVSGYFADRERARTSAVFLVAMLERMAQDLPGTRLHLVAHSTGAEVVMDALERLIDRAGPTPLLPVGEVIFAHADVNRKRFAQVVAALRNVGIRITTYSSTADWAIWGSDLLRLEGGRVGAEPIHLDGVDAIDISRLGVRLSLNHATFVHNPIVFGDMSRLMSTGKRPPDVRTVLFARVVGPEGTHWEFRPPK